MKQRWIKLVALGYVLGLRQNLEIPGDMKATDVLAVQRHNVVNLMLYSGLLRQTLGLGVNLLNLFPVHPRRRGLRCFGADFRMSCGEYVLVSCFPYYLRSLPFFGVLPP